MLDSMANPAREANEAIRDLKANGEVKVQLETMVKGDIPVRTECPESRAIEGLPVLMVCPVCRAILAGPVLKAKLAKEDCQARREVSRWMNLIWVPVAGRCPAPSGLKE